MNKVTFWEEKELKTYRFGIFPKDIKAVAEHKCNHTFFASPYIEVVCEKLPEKTNVYDLEFYARFAGCDERESLAVKEWEYVPKGKGLKRFVKSYIVEELMFNDYDNSLWLGLMKQIDKNHRLHDVWED